MRRGDLTLPDFIIVGAMKSGTTTLYRYLCDHPQIGMSRDKETDFFVAEKNFDRGLAWYAAQYDPSKQIHGEASPNYSKCRDFPDVPARIAAELPDVKLIYILRDPVKRAESQFKHSFIIGDLATEPGDLLGTQEYAHIMDASHYARQLEAFAAHFPMSQILVLDFDRLVTEPQAVLDEICAFIGVDHMTIANKGAQNDSTELSRVPAPVLRFAQSRLGRQLTGLFSRDMRDRLRRLLALGKARETAPFPEDLRDAMRAELAADVAALRARTGQSFSGWSL